MMNRSITQWHNPRECTAACLRVEKVLQQLKALVKSIDEEEAGFGRYKPEYKPPPTLAEKKAVIEFLPCQRVPAHYRYPEALGDVMAPCRCGKRNGLQDYCGVIGQECYMNPKSVFNSRGHGMQQEKYPYQDERNKLRCEGDMNQYQQGPGGMNQYAYGPSNMNQYQQGQTSMGQYGQSNMNQYGQGSMNQYGPSNMNQNQMDQSPCRKQGCINDFYLIPAERAH